MDLPARDEDALEALLAAWRALPAPEYAFAIARVSAKLAAQRDPIGARPTQIAAWLARARERNPADVPLLLEQLGTGTWTAIRDRLAELATWPGDPRIDARLLDAVREPLLQGASGRRVTLLVLQVLEASHDPRVRDRLIEFATGAVSIGYMGRAVRRAFDDAVARMQSRAYPAVKLDARAQQWLTEVEALLRRPGPSAGAADGERLLQRVYEDPSDDEARLVYADWLGERGDPRGEFIALQLQRARSGGPPSKRERELETTWGRRWLGPLDAVILKRDVVYRRGFLAECAIKCERVDHRKLIGHPLWATVERFDLSSALTVGVGEFPSHPVCRAVTTVVGVATSTALAELTCQVRHLGLWHFDMLVNIGDDEDEAEIGALASQTKLEILQFREPLSAHNVKLLRRSALGHPTLQEIIAPGLHLRRANGFAG